MTKVTSKLQVTIPKALAREYGIEPGDEIEFRPAGPEIRVIPPRAERKRPSVAERLRLFDQATARLDERAKELAAYEPGGDRGWTREELYRRGRSGAEPPRADEDPGREDSG